MILSVAKRFIFGQFSILKSAMMDKRSQIRSMRFIEVYKNFNEIHTSVCTMMKPHFKGKTV
jgi:hypothetical protein